MQFKFMNSKDVRGLIKRIEDEYQASGLKLDYAFLRNDENRIYILSKDFGNLDTKRLKINKLGLYFCKIERDGVRLSIEGSQLVGKKAKKVICLDERDIGDWVKGDAIKKLAEDGYFIVKHKNDFFGVARAKNNLLRNFIPKNRRIKKKFLE